MTFLLCRNRVRDFRRWKRVFDSHANAHRRAGLRRLWLCRELGMPSEVHFLFAVADLRRAKAFIAAPSAAKAARASGVVEGEYHFLRA
jgi:hypothetical protein